MPTVIGASKPGATPKPEKKSFFRDSKDTKKAPKNEKKPEVKAEEPATSEE